MQISLRVVSSADMAGFQQFRQGKQIILYDPSLTPQITSCWFDPDHWQQQDQLLGTGSGRGDSWFLNSPAGELVLRHYRRGGLIGKLISDHYLWSGLKRSRPWQELAVQTQLAAQGLPVPNPVGARIQCDGLTYRADLLTHRLEGVTPLADLLSTHQVDANLMQHVGQMIARFHQAGLDHVDLNARNILIDEQQTPWLIDFDRCRITAPNPKTARRNLQRLGRSLQKFSPDQAQTWLEAIIAGHRNPS